MNISLGVVWHTYSATVGAVDTLSAASRPPGLISVTVLSVTAAAAWSVISTPLVVLLSTMSCLMLNDLEPAELKLNEGRATGTAGAYT